jgi:hypothetical protein
VRLGLITEVKERIKNNGTKSQSVGLVDNTSKSIFQFMCLLHNFALCSFSFIVALKAWPIWYRYDILRNWSEDIEIWNSGIGAWAILFYLSKYYEFLDSWILVLQGKDPIFLQIYHHAGVV